MNTGYTTAHRRTLTFGDKKNIQAIADSLSENAKWQLEAQTGNLEKEMRECFDGKQAGTGTDRNDLLNAFQSAQSCPKCGGSQSWFPVLKVMKRAAEKYNAATPVLSEPDVVFGNELPEEQGDLILPCSNEIDVSAITLTAASAWMVLNGVSLGEFRNGSILTAQSNFKDNIIRVTNLLGMQLQAFYFEANSGETIRFQFTGRKLERL